MLLQQKKKGMTQEKKSGIKVHLGVDILGHPHAIMLTTAEVTDWNGAIEMAAYYCDVTDNLSQAKKLLIDGGYTGTAFADAIQSLSGMEVEVVKHSELHTFKVIPKRWMVERTFAWLDHYCRLWKNCERNLQNTFQMVTIAFIQLLLKRY